MNETGDGWQDRAACRDEDDPDDWFAHGNTDKANEALAVCRRCPVRRECLTAGLSLFDDSRFMFGIWGGVHQTDRARALRRAKRNGTPVDVVADRLLTDEPSMAAA